MEYPVYGTSDYRNPAVEILQENGSRISEFKYISHEITDGKPELAGLPVRSARFINEGIAPVHLLNAMSLSLDLPDSDYVWMQFSGVWARERHIIERKLEQGIQAVDRIEFIVNRLLPSDYHGRGIDYCIILLYIKAP